MLKSALLSCFVVLFASGRGDIAQSPFSSVKMELNLARQGEDWKADAKFNAGGQEMASPVNDFRIQGNEVSFTANLAGSDVRFVGKLATNILTGTLEARERNQIVGTGTWSLTRVEPAPADALAGKWSGTLSAQPVAQQRIDPDFDTRVPKPAYPHSHPKVLFDEAHNNVHTTAGLYKPFADLIRNDGYNVVPNKQTFQRAALEGSSVLVIVNAAGPRRHRAQPAFTEQECDAVRDWVRSGGSLLFISDHAPMGAAAQILAKRFNVDMSKAFTDDISSKDREVGDILFSRENLLLTNNPITRGRNSKERINRVVTFTGQSLKGPRNSRVLLRLPETAVDVFPGTEKRASARGRCQGLFMKLGKGRVVVLGEAGMLSAQIDSKGRRFGMNYPHCDNRQLALNIMHWLTRLLN